MVPITVEQPQLWSVDTPTMYKAVTEVEVGCRIVDRYETIFGLRSFRRDAATGFYLNEQPMKIKGVCLHHDLGCLGTAINVSALGFDS